MIVDGSAAEGAYWVETDTKASDRRVSDSTGDTVRGIEPIWRCGTWPACRTDAEAVRRAVFVHELGIAEPVDFDGTDDEALHLVAYLEDKPVATGRLRVAEAQIGRMAVVQPWIFAGIAAGKPAVDYRDIWRRYYTYVNEDFPPEKAIGRIKEFTTYFARNFFFGHDLYRAVLSSPTLDTARERAEAFLKAEPQLSREPSVAGI